MTSVSSDDVRMSVDLERATPEDPAIRDWECLLSEHDASPFLRPAWLLPWVRHFGRGQFELHARRQDDRIVAVLPMLRRGFRLSSPTNWHSVTFGPIGEEGEVGKLLANVIRTGPPLMAFGHLRGSDPDRMVDAAATAGRRVVRWVQQRSPTVMIASSWDEYAQRLDKRWLRQLDRREQRLAEAHGRVELEVTDGRMDLEGFLDEGWGLERLGWKGDRGTAVASGGATRGFFDEVARGMATAGWLRLAFLRAGGRAVAFDFAIEHGGTHYFIKTGYDPSLREFAPGLLLRRGMIRRAFALQLTEYALLGGDEPWKLRWATGHSDAERVIVSTRTLPGTAAYLAYSRLRPAAKQLRGRLRRS